MKSISYSKLKKELLKDPEVKKAYDNLEPEFAIIRQILQKRMEKHISQKEFAKRMGTNQSAVSRLESGTYNPSLKFLKRVAKALKSELKISFVG
ncbi:MAG: helix-turn-helix transcriptional regulator [bacterium]